MLELTNRSFRFSSAERHGFTLIELLVVVAIIALLISILLPSLSKAREVAKGVACMSIQKQLGMANHMYADDADGQFVIILEDRSDFSSYWVQNQQFRSMLGIAETGNWDDGMICPSLADEYVDQSTTYWGFNYFRIYGMNWTRLDREPNMGSFGPVGIHRASIQYASEKVQMADANDWMTHLGIALPSYYESHGELRGEHGGGYHTAYRHSGEENVNILHFDGHASSYTKAEALPEGGAAQMKLWRVYGLEPSFPGL